MPKPKVLLFDLGGVIVRWVGLDELARLTGISRDEVGTRFAASPIFRDYEIGICNDDIFAEELITNFDLNIPISDAKDLWNSWVQDIYPGVPEALQGLRQNYKTACLSNTNQLHWEHLATYFKPEDKFDLAIASHQIGKAKPNMESYHITIEKLGVSPQDIWFFDDTEINIETAQSIGIRAYHVDRNVGVIPTLKALDLLP